MDAVTDQRNERGQWLTLPTGAAPPITSDNAREMVRLREAKRMRLYAEGAQRMVQDAKLIEKYGEDAHLVERAMTMQTIATTPDAGKAAVLAAAHLDRAQGYDTGKAQAGESGGITLHMDSQTAREMLSQLLAHRERLQSDDIMSVISNDDSARSAGMDTPGDDSAETSAADNDNEGDE
jgi:hypothetical protein